MSVLHRGALLLSSLLLAACGPPDALVSVSFRGSPPLALEMVTAQASDGQRSWTWTPDDFRATTEHPAPTTPERSTPTSGMLQLSISLDDHGTPVASGEIAIELRRDWRWNVDIVTATTDPRLQCFGCIGSKAFSLAPAYRAAGRDSLWLVWGGNSIRNPVVY